MGPHDLSSPLLGSLKPNKNFVPKPLLIKVYIRSTCIAYLCIQYFKRPCFAISYGFHSSKKFNRLLISHTEINLHRCSVLNFIMTNCFKTPQIYTDLKSFSGLFHASLIVLSLHHLPSNFKAFLLFI